MNVGKMIKNRRKELGLTLEDVGNIVGVGKSTVRKWETGVINNMGRDKIALLAKALNISPLLLLNDEIAQEIETDWNTPTNENERVNMTNRTLNSVKTIIGENAFNVLFNFVHSNEEGQRWLEDRSNEAIKLYPKGDE